MNLILHVRYAYTYCIFNIRLLNFKGRSRMEIKAVLSSIDFDYAQAHVTSIIRLFNNNYEKKRVIHWMIENMQKKKRNILQFHIEKKIYIYIEMLKMKNINKKVLHVKLTFFYLRIKIYRQIWSIVQFSCTNFTSLHDPSYATIQHILFFFFFTTGEISNTREMFT